MNKYKTIKDFYEAVKAGEIEESELDIVLDNDCTNFYIGPDNDKNGNELDNEVIVDETNGYMDVEKLYSILFPKANVEWC